MDKENLLILKAKKGDKKAFEQLVNNNMYLVEHYLNKNIYNKNDKDDILQDGYLCLVQYITNYIKSENKEYLSSYLHNRIKVKVKRIIKKYDYSDNKLEYDNDIFDFVVATEQKELVNILKNIIVGTNTFTFMEKNALLAKLGFIENRILTNQELADAFNCSRNNFHIKYKDSIDNLRSLISKEIKNKKNYNLDLFSYFETSKEIVLDVINENLNEEEINLLKIVWGDDFSCFNSLEDIVIINDKVKTYYTTIGKIYNIIINLDISKEIKKLGLNYGYALRR